MSENPYIGRHDEDGLSVFCPECYKADGWNEGYNQAIDDAIEVIRGADDFNAVRALRKKVE